jgi:hypothetical protein
VNPDVIGFYSRLGIELPDRADGEALVCCPFDPSAHRNGDRNKSCSVNLESGLHCCHGCGARGNAYQAATALGFSPREAMQLLEDHGLSSERDDSAGSSRRHSAAATFVRHDAPRVELDAPSTAELDEWRAALLSEERVLSRLFELRGWTRPAIETLALGIDAARIVFAVRNKDGRLVGVERYQPNAAGCGPNERKLIAQRGSHRDLFPAPETIPPNATTIVVEGRADAVAAASVGLAAVSVSGAAGWRSEWAGRFAGRHVVIVPDCDEAGRKLAADVARDLLTSALSVRVLELDPSRVDGHDLGDLVRDAAQGGQPGLEQARKALSRAIDSLTPLPRPGQDIAAEGVLDTLPAAIGAPVLLGRRVSPGGVTLCPLCDTDGLRVPPIGVPGHQGWWCQECHRHGRLTDLAALVWGLDPIHDRDEIVKRCSALLFAAQQETAA